MIRPTSLLEVVAWICVPSTVTGSKFSGELQKVSSLVFSRFSWNEFSADQLETWSSDSWALLCCPFGTFSYKVVSSTYLHIPKSALGVTRSLIMSKKKLRPQFSPLGDTCWYHSPFRQAVTAEFHPLGPIWQEVQDQLTILLGTSTSLSLAARVPWSMKSKALR